MNGMAVYPRWTEEQMTVPRLSADGLTVEGWVKRPSGAWTPADLLWSPPNAVKASDVDGIGRIVDVTEGLSDYDWVTAQLNRREKYLDLIRAKIRAGAYRMTAAALRTFGFDEDEIARLTGDAAQLVQRSGPVAYGKSARLAAAKAMRDEAMKLINGPSADDRHRYGLCACHNESGDPMLPGQLG